MSYFGGAYFSGSIYFNPGGGASTLGRHVRGKREPFPLIEEPEQEDQTALIVLMTTGRRHG